MTSLSSAVAPSTLQAARRHLTHLYSFRTQNPWKLWMWNNINVHDELTYGWKWAAIKRAIKPRFDMIASTLWRSRFDLTNHTSEGSESSTHKAYKWRFIYIREQVAEQHFIDHTWNIHRKIRNTQKIVYYIIKSRNEWDNWATHKKTTLNNNNIFRYTILFCCRKALYSI
jgi:hypothetical protein